jgi:catechol 2,3-dioxygenase-like lactoylglutathione lyase family enzyme
MAIRLDHTIVPARDRQASAQFLTEILGLAPPRFLGPFAIVQVSADTSLDFIDAGGDVAEQHHYAFVVTEEEWDTIFARIRARGLTYWADPHRTEPGRINEWDGGRGVYFDDPDHHLLEILTRPYGSGGTTTTRPHPLVANPPDERGSGI